MDIELPDDFFEPPPEGERQHPDNPDIRRAVEWFKSYMTPEGWIARRHAIAIELYRGTLGKSSDPKGAFFKEEDKFGWYLFLAEALIDHPHNYEPIYGARVAPVFAAIGRELHLLEKIKNIGDRVKRLVGKERKQPNGGLFEFLVAAAYCREGGEVVFVPEEKGIAKRHDMDVVIGGKSFAVECKRMETSQYGEAERARARILWGPASEFLQQVGVSTFCDVHFLVPLDSVSDDYLVRKVMEWFELGEPALLWRGDGIGYGAIGEMDLGPVREVLKDNELMLGGSKLAALLAGSYRRHAAYLQGVLGKRELSPRYISTCELAIMCRWECLAPASVEAKARDVMGNLAKANDQLPTDRPGIVHIGFEAVEGDTVERLRHDRIVETAARFDPDTKPLEYIYCHYFVPESPPDKLYDFAETVQWRPIRNTGPRPLTNAFLILGPGAASKDGGHWNE